MNTDSSMVLLRRYANEGDEAAFRELVRRYAGWVYATVHRRLGGASDDTADVAQAVFIRLAQRAKILPAELILPAWLHRMAVRYASNHLRAEYRRRTREMTAFSMNEPPSLSVDWNQISPQLDEALLSLASKDREALLLRFIEGQDVAATGRSLGISPDAAQKRIARALDRLRVRLGKRGAIVSAPGLAVALASHPARAAPGGFAARAAEAGIQAKHKLGVLAWLGEVLRFAPGWAAAGATVAALGVGVMGKPILIGSSTTPVTPLAVQPKVKQERAVPWAVEMKALSNKAFSPMEIVSELEFLSKAPRTLANRTRLLIVLDSINGGNSDAVAALAMDRLSVTAQYSYHEKILQRWSRFDPGAALDFALKRNLNAKFEDQGMGVVYKLIEDWKDRDETAARDWVKEHLNDIPHSSYGRDIARVMVDGFLRKSPQLALDFVAALPEGDKKESAIRVFVEGGMSENSDILSSKQWSDLAVLVRDNAPLIAPCQLSDLIQKWAVPDPTAARQWVEALPAGDEKLNAACGLVAADSISIDTSAETGGPSRRFDEVADGKARADFALAQAGQSRDQALRKIVSVWENTKMAIEWIDMNTKGWERDQVMQALSISRDEHSAGTRTGWLESGMEAASGIKDETTRMDTMCNLLLRMHLRSPEEAAKWLSESTLAEEVKAKIQGVLP